MDAISYSLSAKQKQRIERILAEPDTSSGLVTMPSTIAVGETITIPSGRTVVHPNLQVDGTLTVDGTLFIPSGGTYTADEVDVTVVKQNGSVVAIDSAVVHKTGNETIAGIKTFSSSPVVSGIKVGNTAIADATTLDWYEEGTFTPTIAGETTAGVGTYTTQTGRYTRCGNRVDIELDLIITAHTGTGNISIESLPFISGSISSPVSIYANALTYSGQLTGQVSAGTSKIVLYAQSTGDTPTRIVMDVSFAINIHASYQV